MTVNTTRLGSGFGMRSAAVAALGVAAAVAPSAASAAPVDVTAITTKTTLGTHVTVAGVVAVGQSSTPYKSGTSYSVTYDGDVEAVQSLTAGGVTYTPNGGTATTVVRRAVGANNDTLWYTGTQSGFKAGSNINLRGPEINSYDQLFGSNNLFVGADNLFVNTGSPAGNSANVDRVDILFGVGFKATLARAFSLMDRGPSNDHDAVKIAAVTALDGDGNPAAYGPVLSLTHGTWGKTNLVPTAGEVVVRRDNDSPTGAAATADGSVASIPFHPADYVTQSVGGVIVRSTDLVAAGTTIYGYSIFAPTTTGTGSQLVDWTDPTYYHPTGYTSSGGGLDPTSTLAILFTASPSVPEPATLGLTAVAAAGLLARRRRA